MQILKCFLWKKETIVIKRGILGSHLQHSQGTFESLLLSVHLTNSWQNKKKKKEKVSSRFDLLCFRFYFRKWGHHVPNFGSECQLTYGHRTAAYLIWPFINVKSVQSTCMPTYMSLFYLLWYRWRILFKEGGGKSWPFKLKHNLILQCSKSDKVQSNTFTFSYSYTFNYHFLPSFLENYKYNHLEEWEKSTAHCKKKYLLLLINWTAQGKRARTIKECKFKATLLFLNPWMKASTVSPGRGSTYRSIIPVSAGDIIHIGWTVRNLFFQLLDE